MAKITRIKANDTPAQKQESDEPKITRKKVIVKDKKSTKAKRLATKEAEGKISDIDKPKATKKHFILFRPFIALFNYIRDSWHEIRQVRWPNRKATWKMVLAVIVYTALFVILISSLDVFFTWLFNLILGKG